MVVLGQDGPAIVALLGGCYQDEPRIIGTAGRIDHRKTSLEFRAWRVTYHRDEDVWVYDSANYAAHARWAGNTDPQCEPLLTIYVARSRAVSACFNIDLPADALREAVADLRAAGGGIERWLVPGLEATRQIVSNGQAGNPEFVKASPELLRSLRSRFRPSSGL